MASGRKQQFKSLRFSYMSSIFLPNYLKFLCYQPLRKCRLIQTSSSVNDLQKFKALTIIIIEQPVNLLTQTPTLQTHSRRLFAQTLDRWPDLLSDLGCQGECCTEPSCRYSRALCPLAEPSSWNQHLSKQFSRDIFNPYSLQVFWGRYSVGQYDF